MIAIQSQAFQTRIQPHLAALQAYCQRLTGNQADGEDLLQITLEKVFRAYVDEVELKKALLFRIAKNAWIDVHRKRAVAQLPFEEGNNQAPAVSVIDIREAFEILAERLSVRQAVLLLMVDVFGFTAKETAAHIQSTEGAVKEALKRARIRLKRSADDSESYNQRKQPKERMSRELMEVFIQAFRSGNIHRIYNAYLELRQGGLDVAVSPNEQGYYYFDFRDPNGHLLRISSK